MFVLLAHAGASGWLPLEPTPIHPILVNFTAALVPTSFAADVLGRIFRKPSLVATGWWTLLLGALITPLTAAAGWYWMRHMDMPGMDTQRMAIHEWLGISVAVMLVGLTAWRGRLFRRDRTPSVYYLFAMLILLAALTLQGHLGGAMSFGTDSMEETITLHPSTMSDMPMPISQAMDARPTMPATSASENDGWLDSIHVKGHQ